MCFALGASAGWAQEASPKKAPPRPPNRMARAGDTVRFLWAEMAYPGKIVKGKPFSAEVAVESTQTLSDGNRISHRVTARLYRDKEGRARRDTQVAALGPWQADASAPMELSFLQDPVAGVGYTLNARSRTAQRYQLRRSEAGVGAGASEWLSSEGGRAKEKRPYEISRESLGKRMMEGVEAEGVRTRMVIPAGAAGNERPIEVTSERWYSPELQITLIFRHSDPRFGETLYRVVTLRREDPPAALFAVPADYTVTERPSAAPLRRPAQPKKGTTP